MENSLSLKQLVQSIQEQDEQVQRYDLGSQNVSIYRDEVATEAEVETSLKAVRKAYPQLTKEQIAILTWRLRENKFTKGRLDASIAHVLDTCVYPMPSIAEFISYDRKVRFYQYLEVLFAVEKGDSFDSFKRTKAGTYLRVSDIEQYKMHDLLP